MSDPDSRASHGRAVDRIELVGLRGRGRHGVFAHERENGQTFVVDLALTLDLAAAARSDDLADTVDYGSLATDVVAIVEGEPVQLIETLADRIARRCLADSRVHEVEVTVHKPEAPVTVPFHDVIVTLKRSRID